MRFYQASVEKGLQIGDSVQDVAPELNPWWAALTALSPILKGPTWDVAVEELNSLLLIQKGLAVHTSPQTQRFKVDHSPVLTGGWTSEVPASTIVGDRASNGAPATLPRLSN